jgi:membrane dipeptidase
MHAHPGRFFATGAPLLDPSLAPMASTAVPEALAALGRGMVAAAVFNTVSDLRVLSMVPPGAIVSRRSFAAGEAYADHRRQVEVFSQLAASGAVRRVLAPADIDRARRAGATAGILGTEGADFLEGRLDRLEEARRDGVRLVGLVHYRTNEIGDIQTAPATPGGLTAFGESVVREMNRLGLIVDLAHATPAVLRRAVEISTAPMIVSHVMVAKGGGENARTLDPDDARRVTEAGGVIGAWPAGFGLATFDDYIVEILRLVDVLGVDHVGIGTDMDANYRPVFADYGEFPRIPDALMRRGMGTDEVACVVGGNFLRVFSTVHRR